MLTRCAAFTFGNCPKNYKRPSVVVAASTHYESFKSSGAVSVDFWRFSCCEVKGSGNGGGGLKSKELSQRNGRFGDYTRIVTLNYALNFAGRWIKISYCGLILDDLATCVGKIIARVVVAGGRIEET